MPYHSRFAVAVRVGLLPLALALGTVLGLGSYAETSDDTTLAWLFAGVLVLKPVPSVPLYCHGYGHALAAAYLAVPGVPWLGLLLAGLLAGASVLFFAVLDKLLRPYLRPGPLALVLMLFFGVAWLEHWLWFSHVRVALLLAGSAVLYAAQRPARLGALLLGLAGLGAAWLLRPSLAVLAFGAVLPAAALLAGSLRRAAPLLLSGALGLALATTAASVLQTPAEARTQQRDAYFTRILDFNQLRPQPRTPADSLGSAALGLWLMGDSTVVNPAFIRRVYRFDSADFFGREVPAKLRLRASLLVRDYFPLLFALAATACSAARRPPRRRGVWLVQAGFAGGFVLLAGVLKLPPRMELPLLDFWVLTNLIIWLQPISSLSNTGNLEGLALGRSTPLMASWARGLGIAFGLMIIGSYAVKTWHRQRVLGEEQALHQKALADIKHLGDRRIRILAGTNDLLKSLSPFRTYSLGSGPVLVLSGWNAHDASQATLRRALSGTTDQTECLRRLAMRSSQGPQFQTLWVLTPETATWLSRRFRFNGPRLLFTPANMPLLAGKASPVQVYFVQPWPAH